MVVRGIAVAPDRTVAGLEPLARVGDVDALDALFRSRRSDDERWIRASVTSGGFRVEIEADGTVRLLVEPAAAD